MGACNGKSEPPVRTEPPEPENVVADDLEKTDNVVAEDTHTVNEDEDELVCRHSIMSSKTAILSEEVNQCFSFEARHLFSL